MAGIAPGTRAATPGGEDSLPSDKQGALGDTPSSWLGFPVCAFTLASSSRGMTFEMPDVWAAPGEAAWAQCVWDTRPRHGKVPNRDSDAEQSWAGGGGRACSRAQEGRGQASWPAGETVWSGKAAQRKQDASRLGLEGMKFKLS